VSDIRVEVLESADSDAVAGLGRLLPQVSSRATPVTANRLSAILANPSTRVVIVKLDGAIGGMALLLTCTTLTGQFGLVEEVAVDEASRGQHLCVHLVVGLLRLAYELGLDFVELTSRPPRKAANNLYQSLGFHRRDTNCYRHDLVELPDVR
jgi:N-acetylglutamate synthase-like GNAT family acetyltransferase